MAIDAFVTPLLWPPDRAPDYFRDVVTGTFGRDPDELLVERSPEDILGVMDAAGVECAVLNAVEGRVDTVAEWVRRYPDRFVMSAELDPRRGMATVREIRRLHAEADLRLVRMVPFAIGLGPDHAAYYPVYATCVELGLPVSVTCGIPGPPMPAAIQHPLLLDEVCRFFPELVVIMAHGADPWWAEAIRLMMRFPNLYLMTSDWAPKRLPSSLISYLSGRGRSKILFATGYPVLDMARCRAQVDELGLDEATRQAYLAGNAARVLGIQPSRKTQSSQ